MKQPSPSWDGSNVITGSFTRENNFHERVVGNLAGRVDQLENVGLSVIVPEEVDALRQPRDSVI